MTQIDCLQPPPVPFDGARVQGRESPEQTLRLSVPLQDARVAMRSDLESEHRLTPTPAVSGLRRVSKHKISCDKMSEEGRKEVGRAAGESAVPQELKDMPIPADPDPRKRRAMKVAASSSSSQMEGSRAVAETPTQQSSMAGG